METCPAIDMAGRRGEARSGGDRRRIEHPEDRVFKKPLNDAVLKARRSEILAAYWSMVRNWGQEGPSVAVSVTLSLSGLGWMSASDRAGICQLADLRKQ